ncbi:Hypothetical protein PHPALM_3211 [Phytophthora palmivora]|uniref:Uncharacterized protein n=1 Tax=Phytophthora palmivora TaxID=4796 RepID=A0A2P4YN13_9STRA|nr:Hypothetical protein PHPALM_3211 [Phytophthora palmivora]
MAELLVHSAKLEGFSPFPTWNGTIAAPFKDTRGLCSILGADGELVVLETHRNDEQDTADNCLSVLKVLPPVVDPFSSFCQCWTHDGAVVITAHDKTVVFYSTEDFNVLARLQLQYCVTSMDLAKRHLSTDGETEFVFMVGTAFGVLLYTVSLCNKRGVMNVESDTGGGVALFSLGALPLLEVGYAVRQAPEVLLALTTLDKSAITLSALLAVLGGALLALHWIELPVKAALKAAKLLAITLAVAALADAALLTSVASHRGPDTPWKADVYADHEGLFEQQVNDVFCHAKGLQVCELGSVAEARQIFPLEHWPVDSDRAPGRRIATSCEGFKDSVHLWDYQNKMELCRLCGNITTEEQQLQVELGAEHTAQVLAAVEMLSFGELQWSMGKTNALELRVVHEDGAYFAYQNPPDSVCIKLSNCPNWGPAKSVVWRNLPAHWHVNFFQNDNCAGQNGDVHFTANRKAVNGAHTFNSLRTIRSMSTRPSLGKLSSSMARKCVQLRQPVKRAESAVVIGNEMDVELVVGADVNSSNWFEPIVDEGLA